MHFSVVSSFTTATMAMFSMVSAVNLWQYTRPNCGGSMRVCTELDPNVCCRSVSRVFASGDCQGCTSTDLHITYNYANGRYCGRSASATNGGRCISGGSNLRGHSWCRLCGTKKTRRDDGSDDTEDDVAAAHALATREDTDVEGIVLDETASQCTESYEPDLISHDGTRFFSINYNVSDDHTAQLMALLDEDSVDYGDFPDYLLQYEVTAPDTEA